jgi:hypothetical protein
MSNQNTPIKDEVNLETLLVSNFIRLCEAEGVDSEHAFRELEVRLDALSQLKPPRT